MGGVPGQLAREMRGVAGWEVRELGGVPRRATRSLHHHLSSSVPRKDPAKPKIGDLDGRARRRVGEQDVLWLQVAMSDASAVQIPARGARGGPGLGPMGCTCEGPREVVRGWVPLGVLDGAEQLRRHRLRIRLRIVALCDDVVEELAASELFHDKEEVLLGLDTLVYLDTARDDGRAHRRVVEPPACRPAGRRRVPAWRRVRIKRRAPGEARHSEAPLAPLTHLSVHAYMLG